MTNSVILSGRLCADPEIRTTQSGVTCARIRIAVDRGSKSEDGTRQADFIPCVAWRNTADFIGKYFRKGDGIEVTGSLQSETYEDKNGERKTSYKVNVHHADFGVGRKAGDSQSGGAGEGEGVDPPFADEGLPF